MKANIVKIEKIEKFMITVPDMNGVAVMYAGTEQEAESIAKGFDVGFAFAMSVVKEARWALK